jgi:hypothetical protein
MDTKVTPTGVAICTAQRVINGIGGEFSRVKAALKEAFLPA